MTKTSTRWIVLGLASLSIVAGIFLFRSKTTLSEFAELATQGGEQKLRKQMRPHSAGARVLVFAFDGDH